MEVFEIEETVASIKLWMLKTCQTYFSCKFRQVVPFGCQLKQSTLLLYRTFIEWSTLELCHSHGLTSYVFLSEEIQIWRMRRKNRCRVFAVINNWISKITVLHCLYRKYPDGTVKPYRWFSEKYFLYILNMILATPSFSPDSKSSTLGLWNKL